MLDGNQCRRKRVGFLPKVAVLGGGGYIGRGLLQWFSQIPGFHAVGVCRRPEQARELQALGFESVALDLDDPALPARLTACDAVVDAIRPAGRIPQWRETERRIARLIASLPPHIAAVYLSSVSLFAQFYSDAQREAEKPSARDVYARNKRWMEALLRRDAARQNRRLILVRVGHVWGPHQLWSHVIGERHLDPRVRLLFDGRHPSNSVHIFTLASAIESALPGKAEIVVGNALLDPQWTWRQLFDYHAAAYGLAPIPAADEAFSESYMERRSRPFRAPLMPRLLRELGAWTVNLPKSLLRSCPSAGEAASRALTALGMEVWEEQLRHRTSTPDSPSDRQQAPRVDFWMVGDASPGPTLPHSFTLQPEHQLTLGDWWRTHARKEHAKWHP